MSGEKTGDEVLPFSRRPLVLQEHLEGLRRFARVIPGENRVVDSRLIRLELLISRELQERHLSQRACEGGDDQRVIRTPEQDLRTPFRQEDRLYQDATKNVPALPSREMAVSDVTDLVPHQLRELGLGLQLGEQTTGHEHVAARQGERVELGGVQDHEVPG